MDVSPNGFSQIRAFIEKKENQNPSSRSKVMSVLVNIMIILTKKLHFHSRLVNNCENDINLLNVSNPCYWS